MSWRCGSRISCQCLSGAGDSILSLPGKKQPVAWCLKPAKGACHSSGGNALYHAYQVFANEHAAGGMQVRLGGDMLPGWPRVLHALPGACNAGRCWLSGPVLAAGALVGAPAALTLHTADAAGNARGAGGARVCATLRGGPARAVPASVDAAVADNADGTYALRFALPQVGAWEVGVTVDGQPVPPPPGGPIAARYGRLEAADCEVVGLDAGEGAACGSADPIFVQAGNGRRMNGGEAVVVQVRCGAPDTPQPKGWNRGGASCIGSWAVPLLHWAQPGHILS